MENQNNVRLVDGEKSSKIHLAVSTQHRRVTDGRTDGQTDRRTSCDSIIRVMRTDRAIKSSDIQGYRKQQSIVYLMESRT